MNLTKFLKQTDALTAQYSTEQLITFIHDIGRVYPEHRREDFLEMLKSVGNKAGKASNKSEAKDIDFDEMYLHIRDNLKNIDSQEVTITGILNEEYDDWYGDKELSLGDMVYHELLNCDLKQVILDTVYCAYHAAPAAKRPEALYGIILCAAGQH